MKNTSLTEVLLRRLSEIVEAELEASATIAELFAAGDGEDNPQNVEKCEHKKAEKN